jgi:L-glutamine-phosphate cytidylyltransferase
MKAIILAAGRGSRLRPATDDRPKCMIEFAGMTLLSRQLRALRTLDIADITVVTGYRADVVEAEGVRTLHNPGWNRSNMVATLMCAERVLDGSDDVLVAYADILYERRLLEAAMANSAGLVTVVDRGWQDLWAARGLDLTRDAETMKIDASGCILELGRKPASLQDIEGQYIGLTVIPAAFCGEAVARYERLRALNMRTADLYMTDFLQHLVDGGTPLHAACIDHGWIEFDTQRDLEAYRRMLGDGTLLRLYDPHG